jgi:sulfotransferase family protein
VSTNSNPSRRSAAPVFVLGSPRSGTTLLYDMLLSAGGFAVYLAESNVFNVLAPHFDNLEKRENRERLLRVWLGSKLFRASGLEARDVEKQVLENCHNAGDFLRILMDGIARAQGMQRWAENSPEGILHLPLIKKQIPDALVIHILRDGRDVAMSLNRTRYVHPLPWQERIDLTGCGIYWEWVVEHGRRYGNALGSDYIEVHFEELVSAPRELLKKIGDFIDHDLDYDRIREVGYGSVSKPNTSFRKESQDKFNPVGRWKNGFTPEQLLRFEGVVGKTLKDCGYPLAANARGMNAEMKATRRLYRTYFEIKLWMKSQALTRTLRPLTAERLDSFVLAEDHPPQLKMAASSHSPGGGPR